MADNPPAASKHFEGYRLAELGALLSLLKERGVTRFVGWGLELELLASEARPPAGEASEPEQAPTTDELLFGDKA